MCSEFADYRRILSDTQLEAIKSEEGDILVRDTPSPTAAPHTPQSAGERTLILNECLESTRVADSVSQNLVYPLQELLDEEQRNGEPDLNGGEQRDKAPGPGLRNRFIEGIFGETLENGELDAPLQNACTIPYEDPGHLHPSTPPDTQPPILRNDFFDQLLKNHVPHPSDYPSHPQTQRIHVNAMDLLIHSNPASTDNTRHPEPPEPSSTASETHPTPPEMGVRSYSLLRAVGLTGDHSLRKLGTVQKLLVEQPGKRVEEENAPEVAFSGEEMARWRNFQGYADARSESRCIQRRIVSGLVYFLSTVQPASLVDYDPFKLPVSDEASLYSSFIRKARCLQDMIRQIQPEEFNPESVANQLHLVPLNAIIFNKYSDVITAEAVNMLALISSFLKNAESAALNNCDEPSPASLDQLTLVKTEPPADGDDAEDCIVLDDGKTPRKRKRPTSLEPAGFSTPVQTSSTAQRKRSRGRPRRDVLSPV